MRRLACAVLIVSAAAAGACSGSGSSSGATSASAAAKAACTEFTAHGSTDTARADAARAAKLSGQWARLHSALDDDAAQAAKAKSAATAIGTAQPSTDPNYALDDATFKATLAAITSDVSAIKAASAGT